MKTEEKLGLGEFELWLIITVPDFHERIELLKEWLKLYKISPRFDHVGVRIKQLPHPDERLE
jgi:hypothetical protein